MRGTSKNRGPRLTRSGPRGMPTRSASRTCWGRCGNGPHPTMPRIRENQRARLPRLCPVCCVAGRSTTTPATAGPLTASTGLPRTPTTAAVSGWRGLNTFEPSAPFSFPLFPSFRPSVPHGEAVEIFLVAGSWLTRPFVARKAVATGLLKRLWRLERTAVEDLAGDSPAVGVLGMPPPRADPLRNLRLRHPPRRHPLPPPRQPPLKPPQVPPRQPPVAPATR